MVIAKGITLKSSPPMSDGPFDHRPSQGHCRGKLQFQPLHEKKNTLLNKVGTLIACRWETEGGTDGPAE